MGCLSDDDVLDYVEDRMTAAAVGEIATHLDGCALCRALVVSLAREGLTRASPRTSDGEAPAPSAPLLTAGTNLGRYRILDVLGAGGMGVVYSAEDTELNRKVALKLLHTGSADPHRQLLREAQALARVSHPNVITVFEVGAFDDRVFVAMELVEGWTLREWLASAKRPWREVLAVCLQAGKGVEAAHAVGLVHRDLKPDNVLVGDSGWVRVTDFGLALIVGRATPGAIAGTPAYMAPEQRARGDADARSDQYGFCVLMREALSSREVPGWVGRVLTRGLAESPSDRFPSMTELLRALERAPVRRRRLALGMGATLGVAALAFGGVWLRPQPCANVSDPGLAIYPSERAQRLRATFEATQKPYAAAAFAEVNGVLTAWLARWAAARVDACEATQVRHAQSSELMDLRTECLRRSLGQAQALIDVLERADARLVERASQAVHGLPDLKVCDDGAALRAGPKRPTDPKLLEVLVPLEARLAQGTALRAAGKYKDSLATLEALLVEARAANHTPLIADVHFALGDVREITGNIEGARADLNEAIRLSEEVGDDLLKARAFVRLVFAEGNPARLSEAKRAAQMAEATLRRLGNSGALAAQLAGGRANLDLIEGNSDEALRHVRQAVALQEQAGPPDDPRMSTVQLQLGNVEIAMGDYPAALAAFERSCAIDARRLGPDHPRLAICGNNLSAVLCLLGRFDEALVHAQRSVALREVALGANHLFYFSSLNNVGEALRGLGRNDEALGLYRKALEARAKHGEENVVVASAEDGVGMTLIAQGKLSDAEPHLLRSLALNEKMYGPQSVEVAWAQAQLAVLKLKQGRAADALTLAESSLALRRTRLPPAHPDLVRSQELVAEATAKASAKRSAR